MNKNILKAASVLSACLFLVTACTEIKTDKGLKKKQEAFEKALPKFETFKTALGNEAECGDADTVEALATKWVMKGGPLAENTDADIAKLLEKETRDEIFALSKLDFDKDAATKGLKDLITQVSLEDLRKGADKLDGMIKIEGHRVDDTGILKAAMPGVFVTAAQAANLFKNKAGTGRYTGYGTGRARFCGGSDNIENFQITFDEAKKIKEFLKAVSSFAGDSDVVAFSKEIK